MSDNGFARFVAIGDSQTEGLWDGDDSAGVVGFADRLAAILDSLYPGLMYANLAVRGRRIVDVLEDQLPRALAMQPDLVTVCIGMNDVTRPGRAFTAALADLDEVYTQLAASGATVVTTTFPDVAKMLPVGRLIGSRVLQINAVIRNASTRHGFGLVDLYSAPSMSEAQTWSHDRMHASPRGHRLFAEAAAQTLELPGSNDDWAIATGDTDLATGVRADPVDARVVDPMAVATPSGPVIGRRSRPEVPGVAAGHRPDPTGPAHRLAPGAAGSVIWLKGRASAHSMG